MDKKIKLACLGKSASQGGLNVGDIKDILKKRGLSTNGARAALLKRLCNNNIPTPTPVPVPVQDQQPSYRVRIKTNIPKVTELDFDPARRIVYLDNEFLKTLAGMMFNTGNEIGGFIDIKRDGSFDRNIYAIGGNNGIHMTDFDDFEIIYHTHPYSPEVKFSPPSPSDILIAFNRLTSSSSPAQLDIVFTHTGVYVIYIVGKPPISIEYLNTLYMKYGLMGGKTINSLQNDKFMTMFNELASLGIYVLFYSISNKQLVNPIDSWPERIPLYINPQEPMELVLQRSQLTRDPDA